MVHECVSIFWTKHSKSLTDSKLPRVTLMWAEKSRHVKTMNWKRWEFDLRRNAALAWRLISHSPVWTRLTVFHIHILDAVNSLQPAAPPWTKGAQLRHSQHVFNIHYEQLKSQDSPRKAAISPFCLPSLWWMDRSVVVRVLPFVCQFV